MENKESIITKTYYVMLYALPVLEKYPRSQKYLLADRIETYLLDLLENFLEAYYSRKDKKEILYKVNIQLEKLRYLIRLSYDLKIINVAKYEKFCEKINEIGKMNGGWIKSLK